MIVQTGKSPTAAVVMNIGDTECLGTSFGRRKTTGTTTSGCLNFGPLEISAYSSVWGLSGHAHYVLSWHAHFILQKVTKHEQKSNALELTRWTHLASTHYLSFPAGWAWLGIESTNASETRSSSTSTTRHITVACSPHRVESFQCQSSRSFIFGPSYRRLTNLLLQCWFSWKASTAQQVELLQNTPNPAILQWQQPHFQEWSNSWSQTCSRVCNPANTLVPFSTCMSVSQGRHTVAIHRLHQSRRRKFLIPWKWKCRPHTWRGRYLRITYCQSALLLLCITAFYIDYIDWLDDALTESQPELISKQFKGVLSQYNETQVAPRYYWAVLRTRLHAFSWPLPEPNSVS